MREIDHIGVAVRSLEQSLASYRALGLEPVGQDEVPEQGVRVAFLPVVGTRLELLEPTSSDSPIARFIAKRGEGLHHIGLRVEDIRAAMAALRTAGLTLLTEGPVTGAHGSLVCFVHPKSTSGVLFELCEIRG